MKVLITILLTLLMLTSCTVVRFRTPVNNVTRVNYNHNGVYLRMVVKNKSAVVRTDKGTVLLQPQQDTTLNNLIKNALSSLSSPDVN